MTVTEFAKVAPDVIECLEDCAAVLAPGGRESLTKDAMLWVGEAPADADKKELMRRGLETMIMRVKVHEAAKKRLKNVIQRYL